MESRNCPKCGKLFYYIKNPICELCTKEEEELFEKVKKYLLDNPHSTMVEISTETGVSTRKITRYIKEGRLEITKGLTGILKCNECGKAIAKGSYCPQCILRIQVEMQALKEGTYKEKFKDNKKPRMYTADSDRK